MPGRVDDLLVICPLAVEAVSVRAGSRGRDVVAVVWAGMRARREAAVLAALRRNPAAAVAVVGVAGALTRDARPGDVVVGEVVDAPHATWRCPAAPLLAAALRRHRGFTRRVHRGVVSQSDRVVARVGSVPAGNAVALDMESGSLLELVGEGRPAVVLRAVVDTPSRPLVSPATVPGGVAALTALAAAGPALRAWARAVAPGRAGDDSVVDYSVVKVAKEVRHR
ncbi:hypothetical protein FFT09_04280 [Saccharomonospora piscinae]|uniref:hypothetical protein n=1 Tax=Saccharomonospora piscinae TaxID=687388 RepID=UPI0011062442|nr:hypothetical protein [Saccharomonospora piscinae]TLW95072.1 hypothetical protein FFT09_04280 [Saccharomonospora piscinae]